MINIVMLGLPGSGKGTQTRLIAKKYSLISISPGDMLRSIARGETEDSTGIRELLNKGMLVGDDFVMNMVSDYVSWSVGKGGGFLFDGVPRNVNQAKILDAMLVDLGQRIGVDASLKVVVHLDASDDEVVNRLSKRVVCSDCGAVYNLVSNPPTRAGLCDSCGSANLAGRRDDDYDVVLARIASHKPMINELLSYYSGRVAFIHVDAIASVERILDVVSSGISRICANYV